MTPEAKVKKKVAARLKTLGAYYFYPVTGGYGKSGVPDIIGCYEGKFFGIECKAGRNKPTPLQEKNLSDIKANDGISLVNNRPTVCHNPADPAFKNTISYAAYRAGQDWKRKTEGEMKKELVSTAKSVADRITKSVPRKPWEHFKRFRGCEKFYGCVDKAGFWFDSSADFATATHWVAMFHGRGQLTEKEESEFMKESQCSIIHSDTLQKMYEAGLIK